MPIRPATYGDLVPASKLLAKAFNDEETIGGYIHPHRSEHPDEMYLFFLRALRTSYYRGGDDHLMVAIGERTGQVTGLAHWRRMRKDEVKPSLYTKSLVKSVEAYNYLESFIHPNRAADPSRTNLIAIIEPFIEHHWSGRRAESWYLALLGVDPACEKQGDGRQLVGYGFEKAREENVGCSVVSSFGRERFYRKCGFDVVVGRVADEGGDENPLRDVRGGTIFFWDGEDSLEGSQR